MRRLVAALGAACALAAIALATTGWASRSSSDVSALAVLHEHVAYERQLLSRFMGRLSGPDASAAAQVLVRTSTLDARLTWDLRRRGDSAARAHNIWQQVIGDGAPALSHALLYVCSIHAAESDTAALAAAPPATLAPLLGSVELTLLLEGRQLAAQLGDPLLVAEAAQNQRDALHALAPLLIPTDRAFAAAA